MERVNDIVGLDEDSLTLASDLSVVFSIFDLNLEIEPDFEQLLSTSRLDTISELHKELDNLGNGYGGLVEDLDKALNEVVDRLQEIRGMEEPIDIEVLEDYMENIVDQLEDNFIDRIEESEYQNEAGVAGVLKMGEAIEKKYDYLEYMMGKVRLHARDEVKGELASELRKIVLTLTDGERIVAMNALLALLEKVESYRNSYIKGSEADRIRYKADYILRKMTDTQAGNVINVVSSTSLSGIDLQLAFERERINHLAPSKDKKTQAMELKIEHERKGWSGSFTYNYENRDYLDRLSNDDDRLSSEVETKLEKESGFFDLSGSMSFEKQLFPHEIGDEIELAKVGTCKKAINGLIQYIKAQSLVGEVESELIEELREAKDYLEIGDREEAVDSLEDFLDEVEDQFWDNNLSKSTFSELTERGEEILPREGRRFLKICKESEFDWKDRELIVALEHERRTYPTDSEENRTIRTREVEYIHEFNNFTFDGIWEREKTKYPRDPDSNKRKYQRQIEGQLDLDTINLIGSYNFKRTWYSNAPYKNKLLSERTLEVAIGSNLTVSWENNRKVYPNNSYKDWMARETDIEVEFESGVSIGWETELKNYPNNPVKNLSSRKLEVGVENQMLESIELEVSIEHSDKKYPNNPYKNEDNVSFTAIVGLEF